MDSKTLRSNSRSLFSSNDKGNRDQTKSGRDFGALIITKEYKEQPSNISQPRKSLNIHQFRRDLKSQFNQRGQVTAQNCLQIESCLGSQASSQDQLLASPANSNGKNYANLAVEPSKPPLLVLQNSKDCLDEKADLNRSGVSTIMR